MAAIRYFYNRMNKYHLSPRNLEKENHILQQILYNNGHGISTAKNVLNKKKANMEKKDNNKKIHWVKFTYIGKKLEPLRKHSETPMSTSRSPQTTLYVTS
jgi:hypothetical protein